MLEPKLLSRAQNADPEGLEALVGRYRDDLYSFALRLTRSQTEAADVVQEGFLSAYLHLKDFRTEAEFAAWAYWIGASHPSIRLRLRRISDAAKEEGKPSRLHPGTLAQPPSDDGGGGEQSTSHPELSHLIEDVTDGLPQSHRDVFLLRDVAGLSYQQIASLTGESIPAIKGHLHQARLGLRDTIDRFYRDG